MAGDDQGDGIVPHGAADGPGRLAAQPPGQFAVADRLSVGDGEQLLPDGPLKGRPPEVQPGRKVRLGAAEIDVQPAAGVCEDRKPALRCVRSQRGGEVRLPVEPKADQGVALAS